MTVQEAKEFIQGKLNCMERCDVFDCKHTDECENCNYCYSQGNFGEQKEAFKFAIECMEKQIPKKVDVKKDMWGFKEYYCPYCQTKFFCNIAGYTIKEAIGEFEQCFRCGQALKWGEEDD